MNARSMRLPIIAATALALSASAASLAAAAEREAIAGMVRRTEIRIAPETSGRLASVAVKPGQKVRKGDLIAVLDNPDLSALVGEARAAAASAKAERDRIYSGVRREQVDIAVEAVRTAEANLVLARQENDRATALAAKNFASRQKADEAAASLAKGEADLEVKRAQAEAANAGPTVEERALADARVALAEATVASIQAKLDKTRLVAPADGTINIRVAELGEIIGPGKPVVTMDVDDRSWFAFTVREDDLRGMTVGTPVTLSTPNGLSVPAHVTELRPLGEFATWRAARAVGDHDLNSFRVRLEADMPTSDLEPGMTVLLARP